MSRIARNLDDVFATLPDPIRLPLSGAKLVFFSDLHRGLGDGADDFVASEASYNAALDHYFDRGFTLFLLGDAEELWEVGRSRWGDIFEVHSRSVERERRFHAEGRYHRIFGNHDMPYWRRRNVRRYLHPRFPELEVPQAIHLEIGGEAGTLGRFLLFHGHQGDFVSDDLSDASEVFVREIWARLQRLTRIRTTDYVEVSRIRGAQNEAVYYDWAVRRRGLVAIMGHTHQMAFEEIDGAAHRRRVRKRIAKYDLRFRRLRDTQSRHNYRMMRDTWKKRLARAEITDADGSPRMRPSFFNTGCGCYETGEATCLELASHRLRLIRWRGGERTILATARVEEIFRLVA